MIATIRRQGLCLLLLTALSGCSALSALDEASKPLEVYELTTPAVRLSGARRNVELVVEEPAASGALATERIMVRPAPLQAQYLPGVRWADTAPIMLQTLMVRSLTETGSFSSVGRRPVGTLADYTVLSELTDFQAETTGEEGQTTVRIRMSFRLVRENDARVVATRTLTATDAATSTEVDAIAIAFDRATTRLLAEAVPWIIANTP